MSRRGRLARRLGGRGALWAVRAPLRICPIGAHIDHQGGAVTGMTIDRGVDLVFRPAPDATIAIESEDFPGSVEIDLRSERAGLGGDWGDYPRAAAAVLQDEYELARGFRGVIAGDLPANGLSSSAAVLVACLRALAHVNGIDVPKERIARLVQRAENGFFGLSVGLLDPSVILFSRIGALTRIGCADFSVETIRGRDLPDFAVLVVYSGSGRQLVATGYNTRVDDCRSAASLLLGWAGLPCAEGGLGAVPSTVFDEFGHQLPRAERLRAGHFFGEMQRVEAGVRAWEAGDLDGFGDEMTRSGESSITNYESGTPALIALHELLREAPGVYGTRFSGAGFGGSSIALVDPAVGDEVIERVRRGYARVQPELARSARYHLCSPAGPAELAAL